MAVDNSTIMAQVWLNGTNDFQQRIPDPTQAGIAATVDALFEPMNGQYYNQFVDQLVNRIGYTYARGKRWDNPLGVFKDGRMEWGSTIEEAAPAWIAAHSYDDADETLLKLNRPEMKVFFHSQNRRDRYDISINADELRTAFTEEYGLNNLIAKIMDVPISSDNYDEYLIMKQLIAEYESRWGFYRQHLSAMPTDEKTGKEFLRGVRTLTGKLKFPSTLYNSKELTNIPTFANPSELVLFTTPELEGTLSVDVLASIFHVDMAEVNVRTVTLDEFPIPDAVALLTTEDFFVCKDTLYRNESFYNPKTLSTNYFLHHWGVYSVSPFVPAILFTTAEAEPVSKITQNVTGLNLTASPMTAAAGSIVELTPALQGTVSPSGQGIVLAPDSCTYEIAAHTALDAPIQLNSRTFVDSDNMLHIQKSDLNATDVIDVTAYSTYINPSGATEEHTANVSITIK